MRLIPQPTETELLGGFSSIREITEYAKAEGMGEEAYELTVLSDKITAVASTESGFHYAEITMKQLLKLYESIPCVRICDSPEYRHRGFMIDCARHMFSLCELKKIIQTAAELKFNKFHWHLSDDQGFRIELDSFPEITQKGSVRKCDDFRNLKNPEEYAGYYTKSEIREIIDFCTENFIEVIPEIDMPGHQSALLHVYPQFTCSGNEVEVKTKQGIFKDIICAGNDEAISCLKAVLDEICELFISDTVHIGGDEAPKDNWCDCEKCQKKMLDNGIKTENDLQCMFINEMADYLKSKGKKCIVWNDCLKGNGLTDEVTVQYWMGTKREVSQIANSGQSIIMSPFSPLYVDYPYGMHPLKDVYNFDAEKLKGLTLDGKKSIIGIESPIWTEFIDNDNKLEYMCFPRWFAVAELAWSKKKNKDYKKFLGVLKNLAVSYRQNGLNIADEKEWDPPVFSRLMNTLGFFT